MTPNTDTLDLTRVRLSVAQIITMVLLLASAAGSAAVQVYKLSQVEQKVDRLADGVVLRSEIERLLKDAQETHEGFDRRITALERERRGR